ncbi:MAG: MaoC family dehydratase N-terminal domain-containing protein [Actinomycetota bacterium]|nr:MaoC family dehydratase N-terminal domain-containing protein [Actinomycetota bacterium]
MVLNRGLVGKGYSDSFDVTEDSIRRYAEAADDLNERYLGPGNVVASPVWPVVPAFRLFMDAAKDPELGADFLRLVHAAEDHRLLAPIRPGDRLNVMATIDSVGATEAGEAFTVSATETNQDGIVAAEVAGTMVIRGAARRRRRPPPEQSEPREVVHEAVSRVSENQARRYAEASGDHNPIHLDEEVARSARLPGVILHGMCTMALAGKAAVDGLAAGDPARVKQIGVRFNKPVFLGQTLTSRFWEEGKDDSGTTYGFATVQSAGAVVLSDGRVSIRSAE